MEDNLVKTNHIVLDVRDDIELEENPDALVVSKRMRKELGKGRPVTEAMVLGACMGYGYAVKDLQEKINKIKKEQRTMSKQNCGGKSCGWTGNDCTCNLGLEECPDREGEHKFVPCDEWSATCTCGAVEKN